MLNSTNSFNSATIQLATSENDGSKRRIPCFFQKFENKRLSLEASEALPYGCALSVEYDDALFLGEVVGSRRVDGTYDIDIQVTSVLSGLQSLMILRERLLGDSPRVSPMQVAEPVLVPVRMRVPA